VRLYEIIIRVGDTPVCNTADFVKLLQTSKDEVRLSVERMNQTRVVEIRLTGRLPETPAGVRGTGALFGE
jgi:S1-C subfamily serine protease